MVFHCIHSPPSGNLSQFKTVNAYSDHTVLQYTHLGVCMWGGGGETCFFFPLKLDFIANWSFPALIKEVEG